LRALAGEVQRGNADALSNFWRDIQGNAPLVEDIPGHADLRRVTFLVRSKDANVPALIGPMLPPLRRHPLRQLSGTDVWFLTAELPAAAHFTYGFEDNSGKQFVDSLNPRRAGIDSIAELPLAPPQEWIAKRPGLPTGRIREDAIASTVLHQTRRIAVYTPPDYPKPGETYGLLIVLDGEDYRSSIPTPTILDNLLGSRRIAPLVAVFVDNVDQDTRTRELTCSDNFSKFLAVEVVPRMRRDFRVSADARRVIVAGSSFGGLAAACVALAYADVVGNVLSQSGSYWFYPGWQPRSPDATQLRWLARRVASMERKQVQFYLEAGVFETFLPLDLLGSNRAFRDALAAKGYRVVYSEFAGGHQALNWRGSIADGLMALAPPGV
jgi:enterochelin esterase family protein